MLVEITTFGTLSKIYSLNNNSLVKKAIAKNYHINTHQIFSSWLWILSIIRNKCAHHAKIWDEDYTLKHLIPNNLPKKYKECFNKETKKIYSLLIIIDYLVSIIDPENKWKEKLKDLIERYEIDVNQMGFDKNWKEDSFFNC